MVYDVGPIERKFFSFLLLIQQMCKIPGRNSTTCLLEKMTKQNQILLSSRTQADMYARVDRSLSSFPCGVVLTTAISLCSTLL